MRSRPWKKRRIDAQERALTFGIDGTILAFIVLAGFSVFCLVEGEGVKNACIPWPTVSHSFCK